MWTATATRQTPAAVTEVFNSATTDERLSSLPGRRRALSVKKLGWRRRRRQPSRRRRRLRVPVLVVEENQLNKEGIGGGGGGGRGGLEEEDGRGISLVARPFLLPLPVVARRPACYGVLGQPQ